MPDRKFISVTGCRHSPAGLPAYGRLAGRTRWNGRTSEKWLDCQLWLPCSSAARPGDSLLLVEIWKTKVRGDVGKIQEQKGAQLGTGVS